MGPIGVVFDPPVFYKLLGLLEAHEIVLVKALLPELPIEGFDIAVLNGLAGPDEVELHAVAVSPFIQGLADELRAVIDPYGLRKATDLREPLKDPHDPMPGQ